MISFLQIVHSYKLFIRNLIFYVYCNSLKQTKSVKYNRHHSSICSGDLQLTRPSITCVSFQGNLIVMREKNCFFVIGNN